MFNAQQGTSNLQRIAGSFILVFLCIGVFTCFIPTTSAEQVVEDTGHTPWMFHADPRHSGINDDGGTRPANILKWSFATGNRVYSSPAVVDGVVYIGSDDNQVYALDAVTGAELWNYTTGGRILASPAVINGVVYVGSYDKTLYALDKDTGKKLWSFLTGGWVTSSPVVADGVVYSGSLDDKLYAIDATSGAELWSTTLGEDQSIDSSPAVADGVIYVSGGYNALYALNSSTGVTLWNFTRTQPLYGSPAVANGLVYVGGYDKNLYALDALTGQLIWNFTTGENVDSCPAVVNNIVYFGSGDSNVYALNASTGMKIWNYTTGNAVFSSPAYANGVIYIGSWDHNIYALDALTGEKIWNYTTGSVIYSSPAVANGLVYFGSFDGRVYAVGSASPYPVADFTANRTSGFTPMTVRFTDSSIGIPPLTYQWNFGDGTPNETIQNPVHRYSVEGTYNVTLTVTNSDGTTTLVKPGYITAMEVPVVGGGKGYYLVHSNAEGADVYFNHDWYQGKIENGTLLVQTCLSCTPVWTYTVKKCGYFALTQNNTRYPHQDEVIDLYANLTQPEEPLIADFTGNITTGTVPLTVEFTSHSVGIVDTWNWSFGDGTYSEDTKPVHTYITAGVYTVSLSETNSACQNNTMVKPSYITVSPKPTFLADFTVAPTNGMPPLTVKCTDKSIGSPTRYIYNFGDGVNVTGPNPSHTYRFPGTYTITLTITKLDRASGSVTSSSTTKPGVITVGTVPFTPPVAQFTAMPIRGPAPLTVAFTDQSAGSPTFYNYDFGDGVNVTGPNPVHTYRYNGTYTVTQTVMKSNPVDGSVVVNSSVRKNLVVVGGSTPPLPQTVCDQPYGLCTIATCEPLNSDPSKAICSCFIKDGVSLGTTTCSERQPTGLYYSEQDGWMIPAGYPAGHLTSTYSFINSVPRDENQIPNRYIDPNYTGNIILKPCNAPVWANCLDMKCYVPPADPGADINSDRKAANYTICECEMVTDTPDFYMAASEGEASCSDTGICRQYIWSAAFLETMDQGIGVLKSYLAVHPAQDPAQQYTMPICEPCQSGS